MSRGADGSSRTVGVFGAAPDTTNLGVSALCSGVVEGLLGEDSGLDVVVFDHGSGVRGARLAGSGLAFRRCGAYTTRRLFRRESLWNVSLSARLGGLGNPGARILRDSLAVFDVTGGDSFTDLYGPVRFHSSVARKRVVLDLGRPLVLLPQTYGPFRSRKNRETAASLVRRAESAWARDARSHELLRDLLGSAFDPLRHRQGVDVSFLLSPVEPQAREAREALDWIEAVPRISRVGLNISGLIFNEPEVARSRYGFRADYAQVLQEVVHWLLRETDVRILIVPHVLCSEDLVESDVRACKRFVAGLGPGTADRVRIASGYETHEEVRAMASRLDWLCGTRMHAVIAALCVRTPPAAVAYSDKASAILESASLGRCVIDPRKLDTAQTTERLIESWKARRETRAALDEIVPELLFRAREQWSEILGTVAGSEMARSRR